MSRRRSCGWQHQSLPALARRIRRGFPEDGARRAVADVRGRGRRTARACRRRKPARSGGDRRRRGRSRLPYWRSSGSTCDGERRRSRAWPSRRTARDAASRVGPCFRLEPRQHDRHDAAANTSLDDWVRSFVQRRLGYQLDLREQTACRHDVSNVAACCANAAVRFSPPTARCRRCCTATSGVATGRSTPTGRAGVFDPGGLLRRSRSRPRDDAAFRRFGPRFYAAYQADGHSTRRPARAARSTTCITC